MTVLPESGFHQGLRPSLAESIRDAATDCLGRLLGLRFWSITRRSAIVRSAAGPSNRCPLSQMPLSQCRSVPIPTPGDIHASPMPESSGGITDDKGNWHHHSDLVETLSPVRASIWASSQPSHTVGVEEYSLTLRVSADFANRSRSVSSLRDRIVCHDNGWSLGISTDRWQVHLPHRAARSY